MMKMPAVDNTNLIKQADFKLFLALWNKRQNMDTPDLHFRIANWLEQCWINGDKKLLLMVFRAAGKSTLVGVFCAWLLYRYQQLRILVLAADHALAEKLVRNVKRMIERHPLCAGMRPDKADQWASDRFTIKRHCELRDPSMLARGIDSNLTGSRADLIICDDVEVPRTCETATRREALREKLQETSYVLVPGGVQLYVGTPHHYYSLYARNARHDIGEDHAFLHGYKRLEIPVLDTCGHSAWPQRYSYDDLMALREHSGPAKFESQMMLMPTNIMQGRLNPDLLSPYHDDLSYSAELQSLELGTKKLSGASAYWDPAFGSAQGDRSVVAIIYNDNGGLRYIHHLEYITLNEHGDDEATQQCRIVAQLAKTFYLPAITVEINGIGRFLPNLLRKELQALRAPCSVIEISQSRKKEVRILEAFDAPLAARRLFVSDAVCQTPFIAEMREWRPDRKHGHDDGLDAVAGALLQSPERMDAFYKRGHHVWLGRSHHQHTANTDFKI